MSRIANVPEDPLRRAPMSFEEWRDSFTAADEDERDRVCDAAVTLMRTPAFIRVLAWLESQAMTHITRASVSDVEALREGKMMLHGIEAIRANLKGMAQDAELRAKNSQ